MRTARLLGVIITILTVGLAGGLLAPAAGAQPPALLSGYITDTSGVLTDSGRAAVKSALDKLYADRHIRLWVAYVDNFSGMTAANWAQRTTRLNDFGNYDALLAVSPADRAYALLVPSTVKGVSQSQVDDLRRNQIEPALHNSDWSGAAIAAANGLDKTPSSSGRLFLIAAIVAIAVAVLALFMVMRYRSRRRRAAALAAARRVDPTDPDALAGVPIEGLDDLSRSMVVDVDNAVRTSSNELTLAVEEFGEARTEAFSKAVTNAKTALSQAFAARQRIDDGTPLTSEQRRRLITQVILTAARADRELESQTEAFEKLRDLVINAPSLLDGLTQQYVELTTRVAPTEQRLADLHKEFDAAALTSVSGNVATAKERLAFADRNISSARDLAGQSVTGQQAGGLVDSYRAAESALGQARSLLDAVDTAADDIRRAIAALPSVVTDLEAGVAQANERLGKAPKGRSAHTTDLIAARDAATRALDSARGGGSADPLSAFVRLTQADTVLDRLLATLAEEEANAERLNRSFDQALFTAESRVRGVSEYIDTRRGSIRAEARTKLEEAKRHLQAAQGKRSTDLAEAISHANAASTLAAQAQSLANADVQAAERAYSRSRGGNDTGALLGGIIVGDLLSGGLGGGMGGWSPTSFGGSSGTSDGGFMGGGGRF
jgi:predicted  nucleic acid-binding Zn-ribbon protein